MSLSIIVSPFVRVIFPVSISVFTFLLFLLTFFSFLHKVIIKCRYIDMKHEHFPAYSNDVSLQIICIIRLNGLRSKAAQGARILTRFAFLRPFIILTFNRVNIGTKDVVLLC